MEGAPVMAKAAYRSGECLYDERTKEFHNYRGGELRVIDMDHDAARRRGLRPRSDVERRQTRRAAQKWIARDRI
jgi:hypothetical protein